MQDLDRITHGHSSVKMAPNLRAHLELLFSSNLNLVTSKVNVYLHTFGLRLKKKACNN